MRISSDKKVLHISRQHVMVIVLPNWWLPASNQDNSLPKSGLLYQDVLREHSTWVMMNADWAIFYMA